MPPRSHSLTTIDSRREGQIGEIRSIAHLNHDFSKATLCETRFRAVARQAIEWLYQLVAIPGIGLLRAVSLVAEIRT